MYDEEFNLTELREFLNRHKETVGLKEILNLRDCEGKSQVFQQVRNACHGDKVYLKKAEKLLSEAGAIEYEGWGSKEHLPKPCTLWDVLLQNQQEKLERFLGMASAVQSMNELEQVVSKAIDAGVRFNFAKQGNLYGRKYENKYNFTDYVIRKISELKEKTEVVSDVEIASRIVCHLVSKGALLYNINSVYIIDKLEEFEGHKANMKQAYVDYNNHTKKFIEIAKSATTGRVKDAKLDNSTFYLEYSEDSTVHPAKITDGARNLGLTQGDIGYGRNVVKIGKSEVEIVTTNGIRHYTNLTDGSDIVLIFHTSLGSVDKILEKPYESSNKI